MKGTSPGREHDEKEVKGYYAALEYIEQLVAKDNPITEKIVQKLHALVMPNNTKKAKISSYRDGQNIIRDGRTGTIVYLPPEAKDVPGLMMELLAWIKKNSDIPCPIVASIAHYQFATIHPYYDGNGRTARLLTTLILHLGGYDLKGLYSLEEYYAKNLAAYYQAITIGTSHNYYMGRADADITQWIEYFIEGMAQSFENVLKNMAQTHHGGKKDHTEILRTLNPKQRKVLELFQNHEIVTSKQIGEIFGFKSRTSSTLCKQWVDAGFLHIVDFSKKNRRYRLAKKYQILIDE